ncbi:MAG TPA: TadE/TadG family type IV pilus assembly protein [Candidatus Cybelea sp.]|jgi:Flp pilus assembly protein TadG|nr:TadE/TadG family type IV pilus assembly protein [Candidatus Cybelea sp.]
MKRRSAQRGASLPETAIVMAVLLALLFGIIDFGRAVYTYAFVAQMAREGARWAIVRGNQCTVLDHCNASQSDVQTYVQSLSEGPTNSSQISSTTKWQSCPSGTSANNAPGCTVVVTVTYPFKFLLPFMPKGSLSQINMTSSSQMVISQ